MSHTPPHELPQELPLIIGVGNELRGDDALGPIVARRIKGATQSDVCQVQVTECQSDPANLLDLWAGRKEVWIIDALQLAHEEPGKVVEFDASFAPLPSQGPTYSTHALSLGQAIELSRTLGTLPRKLMIFGAVGADFGMANGLSPPLCDAADRLVAVILNRLTRNGEDSCTNIP